MGPFDHFTKFILLAIWFLAAACSLNQKDRAAQIKFRQYYIKGEELYLKHCSNCHQTNGEGLGLVYPPLNKSDYLATRKEKVICLIRYGLKGEITVNGKVFNMEMPSQPGLTNLEIAEIATYIYNTWDNSEGLIDVKTVSSVIDRCQ